jgi:hypothetical protein
MWNPNTGDWVDGSFTTLWGSGAEHITTFPKTAEGDKVYLPWREYNSEVFHWDAANKSVIEYIISGDTAKIQLRNGKMTVDTGDVIWALSRSPMPESANHILPGNYTISKFGIRPIVKIDPQNIVLCEPKAENVYKVTLLSDSIALDSVKLNGADLFGGETIDVTSGSTLRFTCSGSGDGFGYKIVSELGVIIASGSSSGSSLTIESVVSGRLYIWAAKDNGSSNEASKPICVALRS